MRSLTSSSDRCEAARVIRCPMCDLHSLPHHLFEWFPLFYHIERELVLVRAECWNLQWLPLLNSNGYTMICLDLAPTPYGQMGQIIENDPENGTKWVASSWQAFLSTFADDLEAGEYCYEEGILTWS